MWRKDGWKHLSLLLLSLIAAPLNAQLVTYSFTDNSYNATSVDPQIAASAFGGSNNPTLSSGSPVYTAGSGTYFISQAGWTGPAPTGNYYEFRIEPLSGYQVDLTSLAFGYRSSASGPNRYEVRASFDDFASQLTSGDLTHDAAWYSVADALGFTFSEALTFRIYADGASTAQGTLRIDDFSLNGSVSAVPEPATYASIAGVAALVVALVQRKNGRARAKRGSRSRALISSRPAV